MKHPPIFNAEPRRVRGFFASKNKNPRPKSRKVSHECRSLRFFTRRSGRAETCRYLLPSPRLRGLDIHRPTRNPFVMMWVKTTAWRTSPGVFCFSAVLTYFVQAQTDYTIKSPEQSRRTRGLSMIFFYPQNNFMNLRLRADSKRQTAGAQPIADQDPGLPYPAPSMHERRPSGAHLPLIAHRIRRQPAKPELAPVGMAAQLPIGAQALSRFGQPPPPSGDNG